MSRRRKLNQVAKTYAENREQWRQDEIGRIQESIRNSTRYLESQKGNRTDLIDLIRAGGNHPRDLASYRVKLQHAESEIEVTEANLEKLKIALAKTQRLELVKPNQNPVTGEIVKRKRGRPRKNVNTG